MRFVSRTFRSAYNHTIDYSLNAFLCQEKQKKCNRVGCNCLKDRKCKFLTLILQNDLQIFKKCIIIKEN